MTKNEFLARMEQALMPLAPGDRIDILGDYIDHFRAGEENGKPEEEIAHALGEPEELARTYLEQRGIPADPPKARPAPGAVPPNGVPQGGAAGNAPGSVHPSGYVPPAGYAPGYAPNGRTPQGAPYTPPAAWKPSGPTPGNQAVATVLVVLFNVFIGVPLLCAVLGILLVVPGCAAGMLFVSIGLFSVTAFVAGSALTLAAFLCFGIASLALCILLVLATIAIIRTAIRLISRYIHFCGRICREGRWPMEGGVAT